MDDYLSYYVATGSVQGYLAEGYAPLKHRKADDGPVVAVRQPAVSVICLSAVVRRTVSDVERGYEHYRSPTDGDEGIPADVPSDVDDDLMVHLQIRHFGRLMMDFLRLWIARVLHQL